MYDELMVARASELYEAGHTAREVAALLGVDEKTVRNWLSGGLRRTGPRGRADITDDAVLAFRAEGLSYAAIAARTHMSATGVRMRVYALSGRRRPGRPAPKGA